MPPVVPGSLASLLSLLAPAFRTQTFDTFCWLVVGFIGRVGEHTVTGVWQAARLAGVIHHSRAHEFFARRRWSADELGLRLFEFVVGRLLDPGASIQIAIDDTFFARCGPKVFAAAWHYDSMPHAPRRVRYGNVFVCLGPLVRLPGLGERTICLPLLFRLWEDERTKIELAHELVGLVAERFAQRRIELAADGLYATSALGRLPENTSAVVRLRSNAVLHAHAPAFVNKVGRPRQRGERLGSPAELALCCDAPWRWVELHRGQGRRRVQTLCLDCLWYRSLGQRPVRVVLVRKSRRSGLDIAVLSTDAAASAQEILSRYGARWAIEVAFQDAKSQLGVGQARNRTEHAVRRTVPFGFLCRALTLLWYSLHGDADADLARRRLEAPWYRQKRHVSFADALVALRRELIRAEFRQQRVRTRFEQKSIGPTMASGAVGG